MKGEQIFLTANGLSSVIIFVVDLSINDLYHRFINLFGLNYLTIST
jgi:hypothetical protein